MIEQGCTFKVIERQCRYVSGPGPWCPRHTAMVEATGFEAASFIEHGIRCDLCDRRSSGLGAASVFDVQRRGYSEPVTTLCPACVKEIFDITTTATAEEEYG